MAMRVEMVRPADPDPIKDVNTPEAAAEFRRLRDAGVFGPRNEAERQETLQLCALYERKYEDEMTLTDFYEAVLMGEIVVNPEDLIDAE